MEAIVRVDALYVQISINCFHVYLIGHSNILTLKPTG